ncbi:histidine phosphatase family protein [Amantichitinum ursilacus]|uniref:Bifunctional RNase H/acid phosphatase n=1 Tax=Amantichitinum ursilacus TaxID=857265 RepID=A0A0N0XIG1_9NEIS|nr:histidine phosphatase family protein [Amantichitinum ursilacus]KPC49698.1 bifunctional RNase H/acid phosphatase [Amantichitinum ursilacus]
MRLYLVRHLAVPTGAGICYGRLDLPAVPPTPQQLADLRAGLPAEALWCSSPAQRCQTLARALYPTPTLVPDLQELDFGKWEACAWSNIGAAALDAWITAGYDGAAHGGESLTTLQQRVWRWADAQAAHLTPSHAVVVITHAGVIRALWSRTTPFEACLGRAVPHGQIIVLDWPPAGVQPG